MGFYRACLLRWPGTASKTKGRKCECPREASYNNIGNYREACIPIFHFGCGPIQRCLWQAPSICAQWMQDLNAAPQSFPAAAPALPAAASACALPRRSRKTGTNHHQRDPRLARQAVSVHWSKLFVLNDGLHWQASAWLYFFRGLQPPTSISWIIHKSLNFAVQVLHIASVIRSVFVQTAPPVLFVDLPYVTPNSVYPTKSVILVLLTEIQQEIQQ